MPHSNIRSRSLGLTMGAGAILLWSISATCIVLGGRQLGTWQFLALTAPLGAMIQILAYRLIGYRLRALLLLPPKLWIAVALGFVLYSFVYNIALVTATSDAQAVGATLMNYLWPALTVILSLVLVPGERLTVRLGISVVISLVAVLLANGRAMLHATGDGGSLMPYALGGLAGLSWAAYCALMARWRNWAQAYATAPVGFLLVGLFAGIVALWRGEWQPLDARVLVVLAITALGPWAGGYMLWELALHRAPIATLGVMGAATPILSTIWMLLILGHTSGKAIARGEVLSLTCAAVLISVAVILGRRAKKQQYAAVCGRKQPM